MKMDKNIEKSIEDVEKEKFEKIKISLNNLENKKSKFIFCIPESQSPVASIYELYFHATVVKRMGYDVIIFTEKNDYVKPNWIESELTDIKHLSMDENNKLSVGPEDIMIIPEVYSNIMEHTKNLPCLRIGFLQSIDYMLNSLIPGINWEMFGINNITTSKTLEEFIELYFGKKYKTKSYTIGIPDYFEKTERPKKPVVSIIGRNPNEISKLVKLFFLKYPEFNWITFDPMLTKSKPPQQMRRVDFAKRLSENFAAVWIDRISSFGTFPLECMKSGVVPICLKPDIIPEYMVERSEDGDKPIKAIDNCGVWTNNYYDLPILIADTLVKFLDDNISKEIYDNMDKIASKYNQDNSEKELVEIYSGYVNERINLFKSALESNKNNNNENTKENE